MNIAQQNAARWRLQIGQRCRRPAGLLASMLVPVAAMPSGLLGCVPRQQTHHECHLLDKLCAPSTIPAEVRQSLAFT